MEHLLIPENGQPQAAVKSSLKHLGQEHMNCKTN